MSLPARITEAYLPIRFSRILPCHAVLIPSGASSKDPRLLEKSLTPWAKRYCVFLQHTNKHQPLKLIVQWIMNHLFFSVFLYHWNVEIAFFNCFRRLHTRVWHRCKGSAVRYFVCLPSKHKVLISCREVSHHSWGAGSKWNQKISGFIKHTSILVKSKITLEPPWTYYSYH